MRLFNNNIISFLFTKTIRLYLGGRGWV